MASTDACIVEACKAAFDRACMPGTAHNDNCSGFVREVVRAWGVVSPHTADPDEILDPLKHSKAQWSTVADGAEAARLAGTGKLVLAGLKASDHTPVRHNGHAVPWIRWSRARKVTSAQAVSGAAPRPFRPSGRP